MNAGSEHLDRVRNHPDVELTEVALEPFFELDKPRAVFHGIGYVGEDSHEIVLVDPAFMLPDAADGLRLKRSRSKTLANGDEHFADERVRNSRSVVKAEREQNLVPAHRHARKEADPRQ